MPLTILDCILLTWWRTTLGEIPIVKSYTRLSSDEVPTRSASFTHIRDGFVRAVRGRIQAARKTGVIDREQEDVRMFGAIILGRFLVMA